MNNNIATPKHGTVATGDSSNPFLAARLSLGEAEQLRQSKQLSKAEAICSKLLQMDRDYVGALHTMGLILADKQDYEKSMISLGRAAMLNPKDWRVLTALAGVYLQLGANEMALRTLQQAQALQPDDPSILVTLGEIYREEREYELAAGVHDRAYTIDPSLLAARNGFGLACSHLGRLEDAAGAFEDMIEKGSRSISTLFALGQLPPRLIKSDLLALLQHAKPSDRQPKEHFESSLAFARASALDKAGRYAEAWDELVRGNTIEFRPMVDVYRKDAAARKKMLELVRGSQRVKPPVETTGKQPLSLFILGPSRSGKTTLEHLIGSKPSVKRGYENPIVENAVRRTFQSSGLPTRSRVFELPTGLDARFRDNYIEDLRARASGDSVFTNTHPGRIFDVYRLAQAAPEMRFVFVKRNVDDLALRIYMKKFQSGHPYAYSLPAIKEYVGWYNDMMTALEEKLEGIVRTISYEDIIENPKMVRNVVFELCGLGETQDNSPIIGDDRDAAHPYKDYVARALT